MEGSAQNCSPLENRNGPISAFQTDICRQTTRSSEAGNLDYERVWSVTTAFIQHNTARLRLDLFGVQPRTEGRRFFAVGHRSFRIVGKRSVPGKEGNAMQADERTRAILVVEDNASIRQLVKNFLEAAGYTVLIAVDGEAGLDYFLRNRAAIALLLTDVEMPNMNGLDLADRVLALEGNLPVLFMSGTTGIADRGYGCVAKPFQGAELVARVEAVLQQQAA